MNVGYTAPKNTVYNRLFAVALGGGEEQWNPKKWMLHLASAVHNVLNVLHKACWHAIRGEVAQIVLGYVCNNCISKLGD